MAAPHLESHRWPELHRARKAIVVVDVIESVRLMQAHEDDVIERWRRLVSEVRSVILGRHAGRLVKSLGDGMLLEFEQVPRAVAMAFELLRHSSAMNSEIKQDCKIQLRIGVHVAEVLADELDVYGSGVNLAARIAGIARPDGIAASEDVICELLPGVDAMVEDAGACHFKHIDAPVHVFHLEPPRAASWSVGTQGEAVRDGMALVFPDQGGSCVCIGLVPFSTPDDDRVNNAQAELLIDLLQTRLSTVPGMTVISRMSMLQFQARGLDSRTIINQAHCNYLLAGRLHVRGSELVQYLELIDGETLSIVWASSFAINAKGLLSPDEETTPGMAQDVVDQILKHELRRVAVSPLPNLDSQILQFAAIRLMHRQPLGDFNRAGEVLEHLIDRHPRASAPHAWYAKWHVLRVNKGWVESSISERGQALGHARRALDLNPDSTMSMAMEAFVLCHLDNDLLGARKRLLAAIDLDPNESWSWLVRASVEGLLGDGETSWLSANRAQALSPMDPLKHYYDGLAASAAVASERFVEAEHLAKLSLSKDSRHLPTLRALAIAQVHLDQMEEARATVRRVLEVQPEFNLRRYIGAAPDGAEVMRQRWAEALGNAGVPAG